MKHTHDLRPSVCARLCSHAHRCAHLHGVHARGDLGNHGLPAPNRMWSDERRRRVGHRAIESDRSHRAVGMPGSRFTRPVALLTEGTRGGERPGSLAGKMCCLLDGCPRLAGAAPRDRSSHDLERSWTLQAERWQRFPGPVPAAERQRTLPRGASRASCRRQVVAAAPDQLRWKSILVNHVKYAAARVTGTVSGTSRQ